jgi:hypothetical protein
LKHLADARVATQELQDWKPTHLGLIEDLDQGHHFT